MRENIDIKEFQTTPEVKITVLGVDMEGKPCPADATTCLARITARPGQVDYAIRQDNCCIFFNPRTHEVERLGKTERGLPAWQFRPVSREAYYHYVAYLLGGNPTDLLLAQRTRL